MSWITPLNSATCLTQNCSCASSPNPAGSSLPLYRYSAIRKKLDELDQITHQTLLDLYDYNMSLARSDGSAQFSHRRTSRSLLHHVQRHPLRRQKRDNLVSLPENSPSVDKNDWKIGFVLVRSQDVLWATLSDPCLATSILLALWPCPSSYRGIFVAGFSWWQMKVVLKPFPKILLLPKSCPYSCGRLVRVSS